AALRLCSGQAPRRSPCLSTRERESRWSKKDIETRAYLLNKVKEIIGTEGNLAQKAIAFCLAYDAVSIVIPGNVNIAQLTSNIQSTDIRISQEIVARLEKLYQSEIKDLNLPW
uniref:aldo/keto reductase n=1 Tax=uncultured Eudoraea sp. TaxID=1035614 RepID=UPI002601801B